MTLAIRILWLFVFLAGVTGAGAAPMWGTGPLSGPVKGAPVKNYGIVDEGLLSRSGHPTREGYAWLHHQGVKTIVNLTTHDVGKASLNQLGLEHYLWLPMEGPPSDAQAEKFLRWARDSRNWPLHVHCDAGKDRTGVLVALVRYAIDGWPLEKALEEAKLYRREGLFPPYVEWLTHWAKSHPPGGYRPVVGKYGSGNSAQ